MELQLRGKRALVTGSSSGIGAGIAKVLAIEGVAVAIHGRDESRAREVALQIEQSGGRALVVLGDLLDAGACRNVSEAAIRGLGGVDILVNNAGGRAGALKKGGPPLLDMKWADWLETFEMNVGAAVRMIQQLVPGMKERGWGRVINIASAAATQTEPNLSEYGAAKAGMVNLSSALARELAHTGITVNTVSPGAILTPAVVNAFTATAKQLGWSEDWETIERRFIHELIPIYTEHFGQPEDIGRMVALICHCGYMDGANFRVDGGQCRSVN
jgi:NAD(P)-dependent dehydrogenase (short-subunit alcohol dehydrogenase family)